MVRPYSLQRGPTIHRPHIARRSPLKEMESRYNGKCTNCSLRIRKGDWIIYHFDERKAYCTSCISFVRERQEWLAKEMAQRFSKPEGEA